MKKLLCLSCLSLIVLALHLTQAGANVIDVHADFDKPVIRRGQAENVIIKVGMSGQDYARPVQRIPLNIAIVLDKSGSMGSQLKIENARSGAIEIIERLNEQDIVSLITYDDVARVIIPAQPLKDKYSYIRKINQIYASGSTAMYSGLTLGQREIMRYASLGYLNRIILLSDGLANVGPQSTEELSSLGYSFNQEGISVSTVGVGMDYNEDLMAALANAGGGNIYFAQNSDRIPEIFAQEIDEAVTLVAKDIRINLECADGVIPLRTIGRKGDIRGQNFSTTINNLYSRNEKDVLFEVQIPSQKDLRPRDVVRLNIEYINPETQKKVTYQKNLTIKFDDDLRKIELSKNEDIIKDVALTQTAEIKLQAVELADQGRYNEADQIMNQRGIELEQMAQKYNNDPKLMKEAQSMQSSSWSDNVQKGLGRFFRKRMVTEAQSDIGDQYAPGYVESPSSNSYPVYQNQ